MSALDGFSREITRTVDEINSNLERSSLKMEVRLQQKIISFLPGFQICGPKMFVFILLMILQFFAKNTEGKILIANCFVSSFWFSEIISHNVMKIYFQYYYSDKSSNPFWNK